MPMRGPSYCAHPGCYVVAPPGERYCDKHKEEHKHDRVSSGKRGYNSRWQKARARFLRKHPLCERCKEQGRFTKATVVDHVVPHRGDEQLFWDESNWQALCKPCHDHKTMTEDRNIEYKF